MIAAKLECQAVAAVISMGKAANDAAETFKAGTVYKHNHIGDSDLWVSYKVTRRTEKSVWIVRINNGIETGDTVRKSVKTDYYDGSEYCNPNGAYSMAPMLKASKLA